jgi:hypothetical protein
MDTESHTERERAEVIPKAELKVLVKRLLLDKKKLIPTRLFAELCGLSRYHLHETFVLDRRPISEGCKGVFLGLIAYGEMAK